MPVTAMDTHAHVFRRGLPLAENRRYAPDYDATPEDYLRALDVNGLSHGVLIQPSFLGFDNHYLLQALAAAPQRLRGVAVVKPTASRAYLLDLAGQGVAGIRLNLVEADLPDLAAAPWRDLLAAAAGLGMLVEVQRRASDLPALVWGLLAAGVRVVVDHFGLPGQNLGIDEPGFRELLGTGVSRGVWIKLSGVYRLGPGKAGQDLALAAMPLLRRAFGPSRLVWGSDWPHTGHERLACFAGEMAFLEKLVPDEAERHIVLADTPRELFRFGGG